jgi:hypothetical protein
VKILKRRLFIAALAVTSVALVSAVGFWWTSDRRLEDFLVTDGSTLNVAVEPFMLDSFDPASSSVLNQFAWRLTIGTLVVPAPPFRRDQREFDPFLAETFEISPDQKTYSFRLRKDLMADDGTAIDAEGFIESLNFRAQITRDAKGRSFFSNVEGWAEFLKGSPRLAGLRKKGPLEFEIRLTAPENILHSLAQSRNGFIAQSNYDQKRWKDPAKIIGSGPYRLVASQGPYFDFEHTNRHPGLKPPKYNRIRVIRAEPPKVSDGSDIAKFKDTIFYYLNSYPDLMTNFKSHSDARSSQLTVVVNPAHPEFSSVAQRSKLVQSLVSAISKESPLSSRLTPSLFLFPESVSQLSLLRPAIPPAQGLTLQGSLQVAIDNTIQGSERESIEKWIKLTAQNLRVPVELRNLSPDQPMTKDNLPDVHLLVRRWNPSKKFQRDRAYRIFCDTVVFKPIFPDPDGSLCSLLEDYGANSDPSGLIDQFNQLVVSQQAVLPIALVNGRTHFSSDFVRVTLDHLIAPEYWGWLVEP